MTDWDIDIWQETKKKQNSAIFEKKGVVSFL